MTNDLQKRDELPDEAQSPLSSVTIDSRPLAIVRRAIQAAHRPQPLPKPAADRKLSKLPVVVRIAEVSRYTLARLEYWLSPGGGLRSWLRLQLLISLVIAIPALLVMPAVTLALRTFATWAEYLAVAAIHLYWTAVAGIATAGIVSAALLVRRKMMIKR